MKKMINVLDDITFVGFGVSVFFTIAYFVVQNHLTWFTGENGVTIVELFVGFANYNWVLNYCMKVIGCSMIIGGVSGLLGIVLRLINRTKVIEEV